MKYKKCIISIIIFLIIIALNTTYSNASSMHLNSLDIDARLNDSGDMDVIETWDITASDVNTLFKTFKLDNTKYSGIKNVSVEEVKTTSNKTFSKVDEWAYHLEESTFFAGVNQDNCFEISWGASITDEVNKTYKISYTVRDVVKKYGDCSELYWQFIGSGFEISADSITGNIYLPKKISDVSSIKIWGHNSQNINGTINLVNDSYVRFEVKEYLPKNYLEVRILMPNDLMENLDYTSRENKKGDIIKEEMIYNSGQDAEDDESYQIKTMQFQAIKAILSFGIGFIGTFIMVMFK